MKNSLFLSFLKKMGKDKGSKKVRIVSQIRILTVRGLTEGNMVKIGEMWRPRGVVEFSSCAKIIDLLCFSCSVFIPFLIW